MLLAYNILQLSKDIVYSLRFKLKKNDSHNNQQIAWRVHLMECRAGPLGLLYLCPPSEPTQRCVNFAMSVGHLLTCLRIETMCKFAFNSTFVGAILRAIDLEVSIVKYLTMEACAYIFYHHAFAMTCKFIICGRKIPVF